MEANERDGATWAEVGDFYAAYFAAVGAPDWHGRNLDALWDSLRDGSTWADVDSVMPLPKEMNAPQVNGWKRPERKTEGAA